MNRFEISKFKNRLVRFKNNHTKQQFGEVWLEGHITAVMSHLVSIDGVPYSIKECRLRSQQHYDNRS